MGRSHDRISNMPDPILQTILSLMPLKSAIRTSVLSRRWRSLWEYNLLSATTLDFAEDFSTSQSPREFVLCLNRYLLLLQHTKNLEKFSVYFSPFAIFFPDIQRWISFAASKGVKQLNLDLSQGFTDLRDDHFTDERPYFTLPDCLLECKSLKHLSWSRCDLCSSPFSFTNWSQLRSLSLKYVSIAGDNLEILLINCKLLESLSLINTVNGQGFSLVVAPEQRLTKLTLVGAWDALDVEIFAPNLQSFHYYGQFYLGTHTINVSSLSDAFICPLGCSQDGDPRYADLLPDLSHVKVLTINTKILRDLMLAEEISEQVFPIGFHNLQELQLLVDSMTDKNLAAVYGFFRLCPCPSIERLFVQMRGKKEEDPVHANHAIKAMQTPQDVDFSHLRVIKMTNFKGWRNEIRLLKFLLEKALCLESLIIVVAPLVENGTDLLVSQKKQLFDRRRLAILSGQISMLPKASSEARIELRESSEDDNRNQPMHQGVNHEYNHSEDRFDLISSIRSGVDIQVLI